jgi:hypothetical protein
MVKYVDILERTILKMLKLHVTHNDNCAVAFYKLLIAINCNIETTVMVTWLLLGHHHAVTALILNLRIVGMEVLTSHLGCLNPVKAHTLNEYDTGWVPEHVCMLWSKEKVLTLSETPTLIPPKSS